MSMNSLSDQKFINHITALIEANLSNDWISGKAVVKKYDKNTGFENVIQDGLFKVCPNPATDRFSVELKGQKFTVMVSDIRGKLVYLNTYSFNKIEIDTNILGKGIFMVKAISDDGTLYYRKLIIM